MGQLQDRVAIVTGAGRGIGAALAKAFAAEGALVVVNDVGANLDGTGSDSGLAQAVVDEIKSEGGEAVANRDDVSNHAAAANLIQNAIDEFGRLDVLLNVAGILRDRMIFNMSEEEWDDVIRVHLKGTFNTVKHASIYWRNLRDENAHHRIINFISGAALHGGAGQPNYVAAKMGILGFTYSCSYALRKYGVTSNVISPRAKTRMTVEEPDAAPDGQAERPEDNPANVVPAVAYLASTRSDWCNGQTIRAFGHKITLYNRPAPVAQLVSTGPWELEPTFDLIEETFKPIVTGEPLR